MTKALYMMVCGVFVAIIICGAGNDTKPVEWVIHPIIGAMVGVVVSLLDSRIHEK